MEKKLSLEEKGFKFRADGVESKCPRGQEDTQQVAVMPLSSKDVRWALSPVTDSRESLVLTDSSKGKLHPGRVRAERRGRDEGWRWWRRCPSSVAGIGG